MLKNIVALIDREDKVSCFRFQVSSWEVVDVGFGRLDLNLPATHLPLAETPGWSLQILARSIVLKRIDEKPLKQEGARVLIKQLGPRGVSKEQGHGGHWLKTAAPASALRGSSAMTRGTREEC